ncbi:MAG: DNA gyrase subunit A [Anaerolineales bacterium]|nr:DNA gyrase subunit A [Anaerolineales bacterium]
MEVGLVKQIDIDDEMQQSYLDYAMSVIVSRALPDARDGFKPVHRRILYAMHAMGMRPDAPYRKSARIVGEVLGKYHPHGDMAVYDAMVRMAQSFSMRYELIEGQGNFGSIDGDPPAAMRYTEARLDPLSMEIMTDLGKETVPFVENFDGSLREPIVLPSSVPNLLVNGAYGIAVGMSTSIPPHNMGEICDALIHMLENWSKLDDVTVEELMNFIPGPDFPTGGIILQDKERGRTLASAYGRGRGKITLQARAHIEDAGRGRTRVIITELPYQTNKSNLIERIASLARDGGLEGLTDLRDESDREGLRIVLEISKAGDPEKILVTLYKRTPMRGTFSIIMLALVDGEPRMLGLKQALKVFLEHRLEVVKRRTEYDLKRAKEREHILAGLKIALDNLDEVINLIRKAQDAEQAHQRLQKQLKLSEIQAQAILDMPLKRLSSLERKKIVEEHKEILKSIKELESLLRSPKRMRAAISDELAALKDTYGDRRRTLIVDESDMQKSTVLTASDLAPEKETWVVISDDGKVSRTTTMRLPALSGRDAPTLVVGANTRDVLYLFDKRGNGAAIPVHTIPETDEAYQGKQLSAISPFNASTELVSAVSLPSGVGRLPADQAYVVFGTRAAMVKKTDVRDFPGPSTRSFEAVRINDGDELGWAEVTFGKDDLIMVSSAGQAIRFSEEDVRPMGLAAAGVIGMKIGSKDKIVGMGIVRPDQELLIVTDDGQAKRSKLKEFPQQGRNGKGVIAWKSGDFEKLAGAAVGEEKDRAIVRFGRRQPRSLRFGDAPRRARASVGKAMFDMGESNEITRIDPALPRPSYRDLPAPSARPEKKKETTKKSAPKKKPAAKKKSAAKKSTTKKKTSTKKKASRKKSTGKKSSSKK